MSLLTWIWDLDGTLLLSSADPTTWETPQLEVGVWPDHKLRSHVVQLDHALGEEPVYVTGRPELARELTLEHIHRHHLPDGLLFMRPDGLKFSWPAYVQWKAGILRAYRDHGDAPVVYVGDLDHDAEAADHAGVTYLDVELARGAVDVHQLVRLAHDRADALGVLA